LGETVYGYRRPPEAKPESPEDFLRFENLGEEIDSARNFEAETKAPKFESYQLPGGENYREIVLTLPQSPEHAEFARLNKKMNDDDGLLPDDMQRWTELGSKLGEEGRRQAQEGKFKTPHWEDTNPLAHLRVSDRVTDGKKTLLVDEVQSDWHQAGRERGYAGELPKNWSVNEDDLLGWVVRNEDGEAIGSGSTKQEALNASTQGSSGRVPDAPYKDDWYQLTLRRAIKEAIDGGYDRVALPTGARVADRFDLSKQVDRLDYSKESDGTYSLSGIKDGQEVVNKHGLSEKELADNVGKEVAEKMIKGEGKEPTPEEIEIAEDLGFGAFKSLSGLDLSVGGKGMRKYYDEIYPSYLKKFGKKYGAEVGDTKLPLPIPRMDKPTGWGGAQYMKGEITLEEYLKMNPDVAKKYTETLHYMDITPAMRKEFSTGIPMKRGGKVQFANNIDAMRLALSKG
jgi:hypothetical protein